jgi:hypothetical protein
MQSDAIKLRAKDAYPGDTIVGLGIEHLVYEWLHACLIVAVNELRHGSIKFTMLERGRTDVSEYVTSPSDIIYVIR